MRQSGALTAEGRAADPHAMAILLFPRGETRLLLPLPRPSDPSRPVPTPAARLSALRSGMRRELAAVDGLTLIDLGSRGFDPAPPFLDADCAAAGADLHGNRVLLWIGRPQGPDWALEGWAEVRVELEAASRRGRRVLGAFSLPMIAAGCALGAAVLAGSLPLVLGSIAVTLVGAGILLRLFGRWSESEARARDHAQAAAGDGLARRIEALRVGLALRHDGVFVSAADGGVITPPLSSGRGDPRPDAGKPPMAGGTEDLGRGHQP